ncbi:MAG: segregation and condensation protein A [Nitrospiria bacterium]
MAVETTYEVKLGTFEGPLELLLHLIKKNEINIYDIPIALITEQYLQTVDLMQSLNLSVAGEFLVMAATLIHIKSKMLLPVPEAGEEIEEDPRADLVTRLLEYQRFKEVSEQLEARESLWRDIFPRGETAAPELLPEEIPIADLNLYDLMAALNDLLARRPDPLVLQVTTETLTVKEKMQLILNEMEAVESLLFESLFPASFTRHAVIVTFLALLEVVRLGLIRVVQPDVFGPLRLIKTGNFGRS